MRIALAVLALVAGCKGDLNPTYCAQHREDPDCLGYGVTMLDAPTRECATSAECTGNPNGGVCDTTAKLCVECLPGGESSCDVAQFCSADQKCVGCVIDDDCMSGVCLPSRSCAVDDNILYAKPDGTGTLCTSAEPCTLTTAVEQLSIVRHIIKLASGDYSDPPLSIDETFGVQILGRGAVYEPPDGSGDAITATGANLEIVGLRIQDADLSSVRCTGPGVLTLQEVVLEQSAGRGVIATGCNVSIKRSDLSKHPQGAISLTGGQHEIRNNMIHDNGNSDLETGAVQIVGGQGRLRFNTIVNTLSKAGNTRVGGVACTELVAGGFAVAQNIIANYGGGDAVGGNCTVRDNFIRATVAEANFRSPTDFHLTAQSPAGLGLIRDDSSTLVSLDCAEGTGNIDDVDGQARPYADFCDRGADEYRP